MKYKHLYAAHEARMWLGQVIIPTVVTVGMVMADPQKREWVCDKAANAKQAFKRKFNK